MKTTTDRRNKVTRTFKMVHITALEIDVKTRSIVEKDYHFVVDSKEYKNFIKKNPTIADKDEYEVLLGMDYETFIRYADVIDV